MKKLSFCLLFLSVNCLWSQIRLESPEKLWSTIHISEQTPVRDQGARNTCSAFGVAAALETMPNMPKNISENFLYAAQKFEQYQNDQEITRGNFLKSYIISLPKYGILTEQQLPYPKVAPAEWYAYEANVIKTLKESTTGPLTFQIKYKSLAKLLSLDSYEYLGDVESKDIKRIKYWLDHGVKAIPVSYELYTPAWEKFLATKYTTITPDVGYGILLQDGRYAKYSDIKKQFPDINAKINSKIFTLAEIDKRTDIKVYSAHVVTIVGYDSEGFIIKNSWGTDWRFFGYERISYDYHELFAYEALILKKVSFKN